MSAAPAAATARRARSVLTSIADLNELHGDDFATALKPLFEAAGPLAEALYATRPFGSYAELIERAEAIASTLPDAQQVEVVNAHPRIGEHPARISAHSFKEQGYDRPTGEDPTVLAALAELNAAYEERFGFRFVVFVNKRPKSEILSVLRHRMTNSREAELRTGLRDMFLIARDRYEGQRRERTED
jgi:2-oxo-4-hydroxy-4-carboxy-5-ureidoimidazoline decarboxylase